MNKKISISPEAISKYGLSDNAVFTLLNIYYHESISSGLEELLNKDYISPKGSINPSERVVGAIPSQVNYFLLTEGKDIIENIILDSESKEDVDVPLTVLADSLRAIFPAGKKSGTNYYWRDNTHSIVKKLKIFHRRYGQYKAEEILAATQKYVESFKGVYTYMQLLKYFIWKNKADGSEDSELLNYLENMGDIDIEETSTDWTTTLI